MAQAQYPRKTELFAARLTKEHADTLRALAEREGLAPSTMLRHLVAAALERETKKPKPKRGEKKWTAKKRTGLK